MASKNNRGVSRVLVKLEASVRDGNFYEAHQMYRTLYHRYLAQQKYNELLEMLYNGAVLFLDYEQQISGADLSILLVDVLIVSEAKDYISWTPKLCKIFSKISPTTPERETFLANAIRWSSKETARGHPYLHQCIARIYQHEKNYTQARHHYLHSRDGTGCARLLIELQASNGLSGEVDLFITQAVLQYLCLRNQSTAKQTFATYTEHHPRIRKRGPPYLLPLLNFLWFLFMAIDKQKLQMFAVLIEQYQPSINRDPCYNQYLDKIGQIFFGLPSPPQHSRGFFGNFLENLFSGLDEDSDDEGPSTSAANPTRRQLIEQNELD